MLSGCLTDDFIICRINFDVDNLMTAKKEAKLSKFITVFKIAKPYQINKYFDFQF